MINKFLSLLVILMCLSACFDGKTISKTSNELYLDTVELIKEHTDFKTSSEFFDVSTDITKTEEGYRYYVIIDNVKCAMYDFEAMAIEKNVDYTSTMAANIGIFEEEDYKLIPGQADADLNYLSGVSISGISDNSSPTLLLMVSWYNKDLSINYREFLLVNVEGAVNE